MTEQTKHKLSIGFCIFWMAVIFLDYWYYHPEYASAIWYFQYFDLLGILAVLGGVSWFGLKKLKENNQFFFLNTGIGILLLFFVICAIIIAVHYPKVIFEEAMTIKEVFTYLGKIASVLLASYFVFGTCYAFGALLLKLFSVTFSSNRADILVKMAVGSIVVSIILFVLGSFNLFDQKIIAGLFVVTLLVAFKDTFHFIKSTLIQPIEVSNDFNALGYASLFILIFFISMVYLQNIRPLPYGFDALAIYLNVPKLVYENNGLIAGFSPYYWSLFITLGYILFDQIEVVISLAVAGGIFSVIAIYEIAKRWLSSNYALLSGTLFYSLPLVYYQSFRDIKTDLGLLFILLAVVLVLIEFMKYLYPDNKNERQEVKVQLSEFASAEEIAAVKEKGLLSKVLSKDLQFFLLMGLLSGMAMGIKLTGLIIIFSVISIAFYLKAGQIGFLTSMALIFFVLLAGGLDVASELRAYHFSAKFVMLLMLLIGIGGLVYIGRENKNTLLGIVKQCFIYCFFVGLIYLPWPIKNVKEVGTISMQTIISGAKPGPSKNFRIR